MLPFAYYLLKVTIGSAILFGYYWFALRNKVFNGYNRFYLLAVIVLSIALPLCSVDIFHSANENKSSVVKMMQVVTATDEYMDEVVVQSTKNQQINWLNFLPYLYFLVSTILLIILVHMLVQIARLFSSNNKQKIDGIYFVPTNAAKGTPFSFFKTIYWNIQIPLQSPEGQRIFKHELAHINQCHSWDKMLVNLVLIAFWGNPIFWFIRHELSLIHEFIADKRAVENGDTTAFAAMIIAATYPQQQLAITNNFFKSPIKRRLMMLTKNQHPRTSYISRLLVLPIALCVFAAFTIKAKTIVHNQTNKKITVVLDAGHGGTDPGATSLNGLKEKDLTLALIQKIKALNTNPNINIILSRNDDVYMDVKQKAAFANAQNPDIFISVHIDNMPTSSKENKTGLKVYVSNDGFANLTASKILAGNVIQAFANKYDLPITQNPVQRTVGVYVLKAVNAPSVLIEAGYISNKKDAAYLVTNEGQTAFANNVLAAINNFSQLNTSSNVVVQPTKTLVDTTKVYYQGREVKRFDIFVKKGKIETLTLKLSDKTSKVISRSEAEKIGIQLPPDQPINNKVLTSLPSIVSKIDTPIISDRIFTQVENEPTFAGGKDSFSLFLRKNANANIPFDEGWKPGSYTIIVKFIVETDGSIREVTAENYIGSKTAQHCINLIKNSPKWKPATQNGHVVAAYKKQPITFVISDGDKQIINNSN